MSLLLDIINEISEYVSLVQFVETVGNIIHAVNIAGNWILD